MTTTLERNTDGRFRGKLDVNGKRLCNGPAHDEPVWLPANDKYFYRGKTGKRAGKLAARCRLCTNWHKLKTKGSDHGLMPADVAYPVVREALNRIGLQELSRRTGLTKKTLLDIQQHKRKSVQKRTVRLVMLELISAKRKREKPHPRAQEFQKLRLNPYSEFCAGCGTTLNNYTEGCRHCWDRRKKRANRGTGE